MDGRDGSPRREHRLDTGLSARRNERTSIWICSTAGFLIFFALQLGLWRYLSTAGRRRRFWLGFEVCGLAATVALTTLFGSDIDFNDWYTGAASDLAYLCLPARVDAMLTHEHWDWFLAIIYFLPELLAAALGGLLAACLFKVSEERAAHGDGQISGQWV